MWTSARAGGRGPCEPRVSRCAACYPFDPARRAGMEGTVDTTTTPSTTESARPPARRSRRILAGIALLLACLLILVTTVMVWAHQVAFNTDRFTALVTTVLDEPAVIDPLADAISTQVVDAIGVEARVSARLPEAMLPLAAP